MTAFGSLNLSNRERDDSFCQVVVQMAPRWRVIVCKDHLQWIIQKRTSEPLHRGEWRGQSYVTTSELRKMSYQIILFILLGSEVRNADFILENKFVTPKHPSRQRFFCQF